MESMDTSIYTPVILNTELILKSTHCVPERDSEWPTSASIDSTHRTLPMTDTNISR